jgi:hypothetical protein
MAEASNFKHCARCGCRHAPPTGKKKCKRLLDANFDSLDVMPLVLEEPASTPQMPPPVRSTDDRIDTLIGVVSDLVSRVDSTQRQLDTLQLTLSTPLPTDDMAHFRAQGAIPRSVPSTKDMSQHPEQRAAQGAVQCQMPSLPELRADQGAVQQAARLVDSMDMGAAGNTAISTTKSMRRGWTRQGGDYAPRVNVPWPQDFVLGTGRKNRVSYDELDMLQWAQGCISIIEREENLDTQRAMLLTLRNTLRDAQFHGFEAARFSYGALLSMMEDGNLSWSDHQAIAEERRSALIARGSQSQPSQSHSRFTSGSNVARSGGARSKNFPNNPNFPGGNMARPCVYWNNGVCPHKGDHQGSTVFWRHVCRRCLDASHKDNECPLPPPGTGRS